MSALSDSFTLREVTHIWDENVQAWETEHMDDDDIMRERATTARLSVVRTPFQAPTVGAEWSMTIGEAPLDDVYDQDYIDGRYYGPEHEEGEWT